MKLQLSRILPPFVADRIGLAAEPKSPVPTESPAGTLEQFIGMTSLSEREYYGRAVRETLGLQGAIVDLGCWLGSTSLSLAEGLPAGSGAQIHAFDQFVWRGWMDQFLPMVACEYREGESFLPEARRRMSAAGDRIRIESVDLTAYRWPEQPIKLLLVDAMKDATLTRAIATAFYPFLVPGALLLHQDFKHYNTSWIHVLQYRLRACFTPREDVAASGTLSFETIAPPTLEQVALAAEMSSVPDDEADAAFDYSLGLVNPAERAAVAAAHVMHYCHAARIERAQELLEAYLRHYDPQQIDLKLTRDALQRTLAGLASRRRPPSTPGK